MRISLIVPTYNEEAQILRFWDGVKELMPYEILFVDGGSSDRTRVILQNCIDAYNLNSKKGKNAPKISLLLSPLKGRANQMNYAAKKAEGEILFFVHVDSVLPDTVMNDIEVVLQEASCGCFRIRFSPDSFLLRCCALLSNFRVRMRKIMFGDQGIFLLKSLFEEMGGFASLPLMEDYDFSIRLKKKGMKPKLAGSLITTSSRRFQGQGVIKTMVQMQILQHQFRKGVDIEKIAAQYRDMR